MIKKLGLQMYTIRDYINDENLTEKGLFDIFSQVKAMGYDEIQPSGHSVLGLDTYIKLAREAGLTPVGGGCWKWDEFFEDTESVMERCEKYFGDTKIIGSGMPVARSEEELPQMFEWYEKLNKAGEVLKKHGFKLAIHNHHWELFKPDGKRTILDYALENLDFDAYCFCLDAYWIQYGAASPTAWIKKLKDKIGILHIKEMGMRYNEDKTVLSSYITEIGKGNMDYDGIFEESEKSNVLHYVVEQDDCAVDSLLSAKENADYIREHYMK